MTTINEHPYYTLTPDRVVAAVESIGHLVDARIFPLNRLTYLSSKRSSPCLSTRQSHLI